MKPVSSRSALVYSTDSGRMCPGCRQPVAQCRCGQVQRAPTDGVVRIGCETKGRGGKSVTVIRGVPLDDAALGALAKQFKAACGSGGTVKDGVIEVQGEHLALLTGLLQKHGWVVKRAGGKG